MASGLSRDHPVHASAARARPSAFSLPRSRQPTREAAMDLSEVPADAMLREMARRLACLDKPEKRIILVGACSPARARLLLLRWARR